MTSRRTRLPLRAAVALLAAAGMTGACSTAGLGTQPSATQATSSAVSSAAAPGSTTPAASTAGPGDTAPASEVAVARGLVEALNRGDSTAARAYFSPTASFDSVGRRYPDRDAIFSRFLDPEVIALGGRYTERSTRTEGDRLVVEYDFTVRGGGSEHFTYAYRIDNGVITDVVGRYV